MSEDRTPQKRRLYLCYIYAQYFDNLTPPFLTGTSSLSLSLSLFVFLCNTLLKQIQSRFFFPNSRVPVLHMRKQHECLFARITNKSDGKCLNMNIESLDRTELQRSVRVYVHVETRGGLFAINQ